MATITPNSKSRFSTRSLTQADLREWFSYDPETGIFRWIKRPKIGGGSAKVGDVAGSVNSKGRRVLWLKKKRIYCGRAAYIMTHGDIPDNALVDHIDGDTGNDRIANLRLASSVQNTWNRIGAGLMLKGVSVDARGAFKARIDIGDGKKLNLGTWKTAEEAHAAYMGAAAILHGDYWMGNRPTFQKGATEALNKRRA